MGFLIGILNGIVISFENRNIRQSENVNTIIINIFRFLFASCILLGLALFFNVFSFLTVQMCLFLFSSLFFEVIIAYSYVKAFQLSEQSLVGPLFGLSLVFLLPLESLFLDEHVSFFGLLGIFLIVFGAFVLSWVGKGNIFDVFKRLMHEKGAVYMLVAAVGAASSVTVIKGAYLVNIHPLNFGFWIMLGLLILYVLFAIFKKISFKNVSRRTLYIACLFSVGAGLHYVGLNMIFASYYIALKRSSMVFDVVIGRFLGNEEKFKQKILAVLIIFSGIIFISLF